MWLNEMSKLSILIVLSVQSVFQVSCVLNGFSRVANVAPVPTNQLNDNNGNLIELIALSAELLPSWLSPIPFTGESLIRGWRWSADKPFNAEEDVSFYLSTNSSDPNEREQLRLFDSHSLKTSRFNAVHRTRIIIHGWFGSENSLVFSSLTPAYLQNGNYNVILVDWGKGAIADYTTARRRVKSVGNVLARFVDFLHKETGTDFANIHLIGFSLGAHIAGIAGKRVQSGRIPVIFGLDPALPLISLKNTDGRLTSNDANYVEAIHANAGGYGLEAPLGHADFYVNYGSYQPGCIFAECSHLRAFKYFAESINSKVGFWGKGCDPKSINGLLKNQRCSRKTADRALLGGDASHKNISGVFYLKTNPSPPYAKGRQIKNTNLHLRL